MKEEEENINMFTLLKKLKFGNFKEISIYIIKIFI